MAPEQLVGGSVDGRTDPFVDVARPDAETPGK